MVKVVKFKEYSRLEYLKELLENQSTFNREKVILDEKNRYLYWDKIQYVDIPKSFKNNEDYWKWIKYSRENEYKKIQGIKDEKGNDFVWILLDEIQEKISLIDKSIGYIFSDETQEFNKDKKMYFIDSLIKESIKSSQLEGATTTGKIAKEMIVSKRDPRDKSEQMILNNYRAMKFIKEYKGNKITKEKILEIHSLVTDSTLENERDSGRFREDKEIEDKIVVKDKQGNVLHTPPDYKQLDNLMNQVNMLMNKEIKQYLHPIIRAIIIHFIIGYYHPIC